MQTIEENIINLNLVEPRAKHSFIFSHLDALKEGEGVTIHSNQDLKPLFNQLLEERGSIFKWEELEEGNKNWVVQITKCQSIERDITLGEIAANDFRKALVLKQYGIDFCCGGKKTLKKACLERGLDITKIEEELLQVDNDSLYLELPYNDWSVDFLIDYIVNTHHSYVTKNLPFIRNFAEKVLKVHGKNHPELLEIYELIEEINMEMTAHMMKEENVLFPYIKGLTKSMKNIKEFQASHFGTIQNPISMMEVEHELVGGKLAEIRKLTNDYLLPEGACTSYRLLYQMVEDFERDLHIHVHLENNILFPKAIAMESQILN